MSRRSTKQRRAAGRRREIQSWIPGIEILSTRRYLDRPTKGGGSLPVYVDVIEATVAFQHRIPTWVLRFLGWRPLPYADLYVRGLTHPYCA